VLLTLLGCLLIALASGRLGSRDSDMPFWVLVLTPLILWLAGYGSVQTAVLIKDGAPGLSGLLLLLGIVPLMGIPFYSVVAYSAATYRIGEIVGSSIGRAGGVTHAFVWLSSIVAPFLWGLARMTGQTE
jgi:hypothetical protein